MICVPIKNKLPADCDEAEWEQIEKINVIRSDSNPASNYVICNRICQQLQIADLIVVDVSVENTNVFYEFGMSVALGKLILPICYSNSFFAMNIPYDIDKVKEGKHDMLQKHIGCYPWRKRLFEYYGIRFRESNPTIEYKSFDDVTDERYRFDDNQYNRFPYDAPLSFERNAAGDIQKEEKIGFLLYGLLQKSYNESQSGEDKPGGHCNTLLVYTMDGFLNEEQVGQCIINFYKNMTLHMWNSHCFCGDRVGIMGQTNSVFDDPKDTKTGQVLGYNVEDIIRIGMNEATYIAQAEKIKSNDFLRTSLMIQPSDLSKWETWANETKRFIKKHIRNRCIPVYPDNPIYVKQVQKGLQKGILDKDSDKFNRYFCLFHIMVSTLKYTDEVVVDLSKNSVQALFWLGAAHGSGIRAITVKHVLTDEEKNRASVAPSENERSIFDVAGLWTAVFRSNDTEGFYKQLFLAQMGIEQHTKLMLNDMDTYEKELIAQLYELPADRNQDAIEDTLKRKAKQEAQVLESYYRNQFWRRILRYNQLRIYMPEKEGKTANGDPKLLAVKWDVDAMANLSHYLSKRKVIGKYYIETLNETEKKEEAVNSNFICIGRDVKPFVGSSSNENKTLADHICEELVGQKADASMGVNLLHQLSPEGNQNCPKNSSTEKQVKICTEKVFESLYPTEAFPIRRDFVQMSCLGCTFENTKEFCIQMRNAEKSHKQNGQVLLWRECSEDQAEEVKFYVSLVGASGPSTLALTSLLVDSEQKMEMLGCDSEIAEEMHLLSTLQETIRGKFIDRYLQKMEDELKNVSVDTKNKVKYVASMYLSTALYQYFLPFLSKADEVRIYNGMDAFVTAMYTAENDHFGDFNKDGNDCYKIMKSVLQSVVASFRGVEAFYTVDVTLDQTDTDSRKITSIEKENDNNAAVSCIFLEKVRKHEDEDI